MGHRHSVDKCQISLWDRNDADFDLVEDCLRAAHLETFGPTPRHFTTKDPKTAFPGDNIQLSKSIQGVSVVKGGSLVLYPDNERALPLFLGRLHYDTRRSKLHSFGAEDNLFDAFRDESAGKRGELLRLRNRRYRFDGYYLAHLSLRRSEKQDTEAWILDFSVDYEGYPKLRSKNWRKLITREAIKLIRLNKYETEVEILSYMSGIPQRHSHLPEIGCFCLLADLKFLLRQVKVCKVKDEYSDQDSRMVIPATAKLRYPVLLPLIPWYYYWPSPYIENSHTPLLSYPSSWFPSLYLQYFEAEPK